MILKGLHWAAGQALKRAGYQWEVRRGGELKLGLWRKSWHPRGTKALSNHSPRRLVLIPGFGDTPMSWMSVLTLLRPSIRRNFDEIVLIDFPGFSGFLADERAFPSMDLLKNTLFDALDSLRPQTLLAHSLGGWLATLYAVECGENLRPRIQNAGPHAQWSGPEQVILANPSGVFADEQTARDLRDKFEFAFTGTPEGFQKLRPHLFGREPIWFRWLQNHYSGFFKSEENGRFIASVGETHLITEERLKSIRARVWLIWGELDTLVVPTAIPVFLKQIQTQCRAILLKNCGHTPQIEAPTALALALSQIFAEGAGRKARYFAFPASRRFWKLIEES